MLSNADIWARLTGMNLNLHQDWPRCTDDAGSASLMFHETEEVWYWAYPSYGLDDLVMVDDIAAHSMIASFLMCQAVNLSLAVEFSDSHCPLDLLEALLPAFLKIGGDSGQSSPSPQSVERPPTASGPIPSLLGV